MPKACHSEAGRGESKWAHDRTHETGPIVNISVCQPLYFILDKPERGLNVLNKKNNSSHQHIEKKNGWKYNKKYNRFKRKSESKLNREQIICNALMNRYFYPALTHTVALCWMCPGSLIFRYEYIAAQMELHQPHTSCHSAMSVWKAQLSCDTTVNRFPDRAPQIHTQRAAGAPSSWHQTTSEKVVWRLFSSNSDKITLIIMLMII